jgi:hypothetical protein
MPKLAVKVGIAKRVHAHGLRHTHAAELRAEGVDIGIISEQLGHTSIATTVRYLDHIAPVAVVEAMRERAWPALAQDASPHSPESGFRDAPAPPIGVPRFSAPAARR